MLVRLRPWSLVLTALIRKDLEEGHTIIPNGYNIGIFPTSFLLKRGPAIK